MTLESGKVFRYLQDVGKQASPGNSSSKTFGNGVAVLATRIQKTPNDLSVVSTAGFYHNVDKVMALIALISALYDIINKDSKKLDIALIAKVPKHLQEYMKEKEFVLRYSDLTKLKDEVIDSIVEAILNNETNMVLDKLLVNEELPEAVWK